MDERNDGNVTIDEIAMLLGAKDIQIHALQKQLKAAHEKITELQKASAE